MKEIAILVTCYNRKEKTIKGLKSLFEAINKFNSITKFDVYLVDDGSTDGTSEEITQNFSKIKLIQGSGDLYWAGGMRLAWETALSTNPNYDAYLLINDDVVYKEDFLSNLIKTHKFCLKHYNQTGIYVSSTKNFTNSKLSYGGTLIVKKGIRVKSKKLNPSDVPIPCSMANANILMVTKDVVNAIGIFDSKYIHTMADYDYSLTASKKGIPVLVCPGFGGYCEFDFGNQWLSDASLNERIKFLYSIKGCNYRDQIYYLKKHFKFQYPYYLIMLWLKTLFPIIWDKFKKNRTTTG